MFRGLGLLDGLACFVAGTQVAVELVDESDPQEYSETTPITLGTRTAYLTVSIEKIAAGTTILARDENDPLAALQKCVVEKVFCRLTFHLRILTLRMSDGRVQIIYTTDAHPAYESETQWTPAGELKIGDRLMEASGTMAMVVATRRETHPEGIRVFNLRVAEAHTYLVRAEGFNGEPIWVHNIYKQTLGGNSEERTLFAEVFDDAGLDVRTSGSLKMAEVRALGEEGELAARIVKNTEHIPSLSGTAAYRIPDELTPTTLTEVKNVQSLDFDSQLQDSLHFAIMTERDMILVVRPTTTLSPDLKAAVNAGWINLRFL